MNVSTRTQLGKAIHTVLKQQSAKSAPPDMITLSEAILDAVTLVVDMNADEEGIASASEDTQRALAWNIQENRQEAGLAMQPPPADQSVKPAPREVARPKSSIILPGDPEFSDPRPENLRRRVAVHTSAAGRPAVRKEEKPKWTEADLIEQLNSNMPKSIRFSPINMPDVELQAEINTMNHPGLGVDITYKHRNMADSSGGGAIEGEAVKIDLVARKFFSIYHEDAIDFDVLEQQMRDQLSGLYKARDSEMEPVSRGQAAPLTERGLRFDKQNLPMGDDHGERFRPGQGSSADPYAKKENDKILQSAVESVRQTNRQYGNRG